MNLYVGIDLHSTNSYVAILNDDLKRIKDCRVANDRQKILSVFACYKNDIDGVVVESTYNWYWLVDSLMDEGYHVHLANPAAIQQYSVLKYSDDKHDAYWLAKMLKLGVLPVGYIYPKETRGIRDLLRRRCQLVQQRTSLKMMLQQICSNKEGLNLSNNAMERLKECDLEKIFTEETWRMNGQYLYNTIGFLKKQIDGIERYILKKHKESSVYQGLQTVPGIGEVLGLTIALETGPIERFATERNYASYCRCVPSAYWSNNKKKGSGNQKNGNKYLSWAYAEASCFCLRHCEAAKKYHQRKVAKTNQPSAYRAMANKLAKACYFIMRDGVAFDENKLFGN